MVKHRNSKYGLELQFNFKTPHLGKNIYERVLSLHLYLMKDLPYFFFLPWNCLCILSVGF